MTRFVASSKARNQKSPVWLSRVSRLFSLQPGQVLLLAHLPDASHLVIKTLAKALGKEM